jgi:protocatechuate 3,4-dioxygenase beta subunit
VTTALAASDPGEYKCPPTPADALGPFYQANAPVRASVGKGYVLSGVVKSARDCAPIQGARIEFWLAEPSGDYDDQHRATVVANQTGAYRFESNYPPRYSFRPPHIHLKVSAPGFKTLVTQHYPQKGQTQATFDLVLAPAG